MQINFKDFVYAPILKWKQGEYQGLSQLPYQIKNRVVPIFDMPPHGSFDHEMQKILTPAEHIKSFGSRLSSVWGGRLCFIDASNIDTQQYRSASDGVHPLIALFERTRLFAPKGICAPATTLSRSCEYQSAVKELAKKDSYVPVCIRVSIADFDDGAIEQKINVVLTLIDIAPERVMLVIDCIGLNLSDTESISKLLAENLNSLPFLHRWKSLALSMCAIPEQLIVKPNSTVILPRTDWVVFKYLCEKYNSRRLLRLPLFSDYGIENSSFPPPAPVMPATQLRYSTLTDIHIFKGENTKTAGYKGIFPVADQLKKSGIFMGEEFSYGDKAIDQLSKAVGKTGNASSWKKFGVAHHITLVAQEASKLLSIAPTITTPETEQEPELNLFEDESA